MEAIEAEIKDRGNPPQSDAPGADGTVISGEIVDNQPGSIAGGAPTPSSTAPAPTQSAAPVSTGASVVIDSATDVDPSSAGDEITGWAIGSSVTNPFTMRDVFLVLSLGKTDLANQPGWASWVKEYEEENGGASSSASPCPKMEVDGKVPTCAD